MPEFLTTYRGRNANVEINEDGMVLDIYPVDKADNFIATENDKIAFEIDYHAKIQDVLDEHAWEVRELRKARGRERVGE